MSTQRTTHHPTPATRIAPGAYRLAPESSAVTFRTRAMLGLMKVDGTFDRTEGELEVREGPTASGTVRIAVQTIDTGIEKRDQHLNRDDFFDTAKHPESVFRLTAIEPSGEAVGTLTIRDKTIDVRTPVSVSTVDGRLHVGAEFEVDHHAAGLPFRKPLMISGKARVRANLVFTGA